MNKKEIQEKRAQIAKLKQLLPTFSEKKREIAEKAIEDLLRNLAANDFHSYLEYMAPEIMPDDFVDGVHLILYCAELESVLASVLNPKKGKKGEKLQFMLPPGAMKSLTLNLFVTYVFGKKADVRILHIGNSTQFAEDNFGVRIRDVMGSPKYAKLFPKTKIRADMKRKGYFKTVQGGEYYCAGAGSSLAGRRAHVSICDDVISEQTAYSKTERNKICKWYVPGLRSRKLPGGSEIIVNTRWHLEDLSGYIMALDEKAGNAPWRTIKIPAILDKEAAKLLRMEEGSSFWPELWPLEDLIEKKNSCSPTEWASLYMQNPILEEGAIFQESHFNMWIDPAPVCDLIFVTFDTAFSEKERADYSAYNVWGRFSEEIKDFRGKTVEVGRLILLDLGRGHWDFGTLVDKFKEVYDTYNPEVMVIEKKASGQSLLQEMTKLGYPVDEFLPDKRGAKTERAHACIPYLKSGAIFIYAEEGNVDEDELEAFLDELYGFPYVNNDDYVDTLTMAILYMRDHFMLGSDRHGSINNEDDDEDEPIRSKPRTYWSK